jgi:hypothetical protein
MSDANPDPMDDPADVQSYEQTPDEIDQLDQDQLQPYNNLDDSVVADALDEGYSPPERPSALIREGPHETLDERLSEEIPEPDPYSDDDVDEDDNLTVRADEEGLDEGEVGDLRAGRLVDPNEGIGLDEDKDLIGEDVGVDGGAASAEEAAMHIVPE